MDEVDRSFMPLRMAHRYVEIYRNKGKAEADVWWNMFHWMPSTEEVKEMQLHINRILSSKT